MPTHMAPGKNTEHRTGTTQRQPLQQIVLALPEHLNAIQQGSTGDAHQQESTEIERPGTGVVPFGQQDQRDNQGQHTQG
ncbi:hypothetical protein D3C84_1110960 [compost metagenome]